MTKIVIVSSIHLEPHNTIYAFINTLKKLLSEKKYSVDIVFRDKSKPLILFMETLRYLFWLIGVKGILRSYVLSHKFIHYMIYNELKKHLKEVKENTGDLSIVSNDPFAGIVVSTIKNNYIEILHGKTLYEISVENPRILSNNKVLREYVLHELNVYLKASKIIIVDEELRNYIKLISGAKYYKLFKNKIIYIPNPIDTKIFNVRKRIISDDVFVITHVLSSSTLGKDYDLLVYTLFNLKEKIPRSKNVFVLIVGNYRILPKNIYEKLRSLSSNRFKVFFIGSIPNVLMPLIYSNSNIVINPLSRLVSGISRVSLEAMLCGAVPVTTPEGEVYPLINGVSGIIVPRDPVKASEIIYLYIDDPQLLENISKKAIKLSKGYVEEINNKWTRILGAV